MELLKRLAFFFPILLIIGLAVPSTAQQTVLKIAAIVNDEVISAYDLHARMMLTVKSSDLDASPEVFSRLAPAVLRNLIDEKLKLQAAKGINITITEAETLTALSSIAQQNKVPPDRLDEFLARQGVDKKELLKQVRAELSWLKVVRRKSMSQIKISEEEINEALREIEENAGKPERLLAEIFLPVDKPDRESEVLQLAEKLKQQLRSGANFPALARSFSQSSSAAVGGDLGWVRKGALPDEIESALAQMKPGNMSDPIRTIAGYYLLILRSERINPGFGNREDTLVLSQLYFPVSANAPDSEVASQTRYADNMRRSARSCADIEALGRQLENRQSGSLGEMKLTSLPQNIRSIVADLPVNQTSQPQLINGGIVVFMVCDRKIVERDIDERRRVEQTLIEKRLDIAARQILRDLRRTAFVDIRL